MIEAKYYDAELGIDGTADELCSWAERYTDDYSDEALEKIITILQAEGKTAKAKRIEYELESRREVNANKFDLGRIKLWALDGMYELVDHSEETYHLNVYYEQNKILIHVETVDDDPGEDPRSNTISMPLDDFLNLTSEDFERIVNECYFYAV